MLSRFGNCRVVPRWTTAQGGTNCLFTCSIFLVSLCTAGPWTFSTYTYATGPRGGPPPRPRGRRVGEAGSAEAGARRRAGAALRDRRGVGSVARSLIEGAGAAGEAG